MYSRLAKVGVAVTHKTAIQVMHKLGENYDQKVLQWKASSDSSTVEGFGSEFDIEISTCQSDDESESNPSSPLAFPLPQEPLPVPTVSIREPSYIIVGDNLDKNVSPRDMRVDHQVQSIHYFHSYAVHDRADFSKLSGEDPQGKLQNDPFTKFLPSPDDCSQLRENYINLIARVIVEKLPHFNKLSDCLPVHISHEFSRVMKEKSVVVSAWLFLH